MIMRAVVAIAILFAACTRADATEAAVETATAVTPSAPALDARDQYALLGELEAAIGSGLDRDGNAMAAVRSAWLGKRFRWEVGFVPVFCASQARCHVAPFDHGRRPDRRIRQGFMPELALDDAGFAAVRAACEGHSPCVLEIEGTLGKFAFSPDEATALRLDDVRIRGARTARGDESWIVSPSPGRAS
ncbi:MAG TPA: hypothetical protein VFG69_10115 [Nannocystaceae bacterium]|nr:hypothetical protein [Nannocystaceae bacterium]